MQIVLENIGSGVLGLHRIANSSPSQISTMATSPGDGNPSINEATVTVGNKVGVSDYVYLRGYTIR